MGGRGVLWRVSMGVPAAVPCTAAKMVEVTAGDLTARAVPWVSNAMASSMLTRGLSDTCSRLVVEEEEEGAGAGVPAALALAGAPAPCNTPPGDARDRGKAPRALPPPPPPPCALWPPGTPAPLPAVEPPSRLKPGNATGVVNLGCTVRGCTSDCGTGVKAGTIGRSSPTTVPANPPASAPAAGGKENSGLVASGRVSIMWSW